MTLTAMRPDAGLSKGREVSLLRVARTLPRSLDDVAQDHHAISAVPAKRTAFAPDDPLGLTIDLDYQLVDSMLDVLEPP